MPTAKIALALACLIQVLSPVRASAAGGGDFLGNEVCLSCHEALHEGFTALYDQTIHAKVLNATNARRSQWANGCEACHGAGGDHVTAGGGKGVGNLETFAGEGREAIASQDAQCMSCHQGGERLHWSGSTHQTRDVGCASCHTVMRQVSRKNQLNKTSVVDTCSSCHLIQRSRQFRNAHMPVREGKLDCASCHNPHGTIADAMIEANTINDNCYSCHADKRGPFLWEHAPVAESCLNCHDPHGTTRDNMLKMTAPRLCQTCHIGSGHSSEPRSPDHAHVRGSSCVNCHTNVHGSNHPSGNRFTR